MRPPTSHRLRSRLASILLVPALVAACTAGASRDQAESGDDSAAAPIATAGDTVPTGTDVARAREAANALGKELQTMLFATLDSAGPSGAVVICADSAQARTARHAREGVYVRRVSLRVRNPANRPDAIEEAVLVRLDSLHRAGALPAEVTRLRALPGGGVRVEYLRPILVQERCLACHGERETLAPAVRTALAERYPDDMATGYRVGDLRGALSVRTSRE